MLLLASELKASEARLKLEQAKRAEKEKAKLEKEKAINDRRKEREREREQGQQRLRMAAEARRQEDLARIEALTEHNQGVFYQATLQAFPLDESIIAAKGIRRAEDKISLPPSAGSQLLSMDATRNGGPRIPYLHTSTPPYLHVRQS